MSGALAWNFVDATHVVPSVDLMILGSKGTTNWADTFFGSTAAGIQSYSSNNPVELLVIVTCHHSFWEKMMVQSTTTSLV